MNSFTASVHELEGQALLAIRLKRHNLMITNSKVPLTPNIFTELLSGEELLYRYGVLLRRNGKNVEEVDKLIEKFVEKLGKTANFGCWANRDERRAILHPPFESFKASKKHAVSVDIGEAVTQIYVDPLDIFRPEDQDAQIIQFPAPEQLDISEIEATA